MEAMEMTLDESTTAVALGKFATLYVDTGKFTPAVNDYIYAYGLKQVLNDAHASITAEVEPDEHKRNAQKIAAAEKKLESMYNGELGRTRDSGGDPVEREIRKMAEAALVETIRGMGKKRKEFTTEAWKKTLEIVIRDNRAEYWPIAIETVMKRKNSGKIDLTALGL